MFKFSNILEKPKNLHMHQFCAKLQQLLQYFVYMSAAVGLNQVKHITTIRVMRPQCSAVSDCISLDSSVLLRLVFDQVSCGCNRIYFHHGGTRRALQMQFDDCRFLERLLLKCDSIAAHCCVVVFHSAGE